MLLLEDAADRCRVKELQELLLQRQGSRRQQAFQMLLRVRMRMSGLQHHQALDTPAQHTTGGDAVPVAFRDDGPICGAEPRRRHLYIYITSGEKTGGRAKTGVAAPPCISLDCVTHH